MASQAIPAARREVPPRTERRDAWWVEPLITALVLGAFIVYTTFAMLQGAHYFAEPYLSPFYSPCLSANCVHPTLPLVGSFWTLSPALLIFWIPLGFRTTCYYYRKAYYRAFFFSPPACAVPDAAKTYRGETVFPFILQNVHRYFFYLATIVLLFLWWDAILAFRFPKPGGHYGFGVGLGSIVLLVNVLLLTGYSISCHSCRYLFGGRLDRFHGNMFWYRVWHFLSRLNERHQNYAWVSLIFVALTDLYVRLVSMGVIADPRVVF